jgi:hypothetical protein
MHTLQLIINPPFLVYSLAHYSRRAVQLYTLHGLPTRGRGNRAGCNFRNIRSNQPVIDDHSDRQIGEEIIFLD